MREKFDLNQMRQEIEEDEKVNRQDSKKVSQDDIQRMLMAKRKKGSEAS